MDGVFFYSKNKIQFIEDDGFHDDDEDEDSDDIAPDTVTHKAVKEDTRKRLVYNEKNSNGDDPIKLYLREIGKENLLSAEQEVELSKKMEDGENIIKGVIKHSGMMIPEFYLVAQKAFSRIDPHETGKPRKEINEEMAEKRRLRTYYSEVLKPILPEMKQYIQVKKQLYDADPTKNIFEDESLLELQKTILPALQTIDIQSEEIERFSDNIDATRRISEYRHRQERSCRIAYC